MSKTPRIVLLHGTPVAVEPIQKSFAVRWPQAEIVNLLDDSLSVDRAKDRDLTPRMFELFTELGGYARRIGAMASWLPARPSVRPSSAWRASSRYPFSSPMKRCSALP
jgi:hypothetical protein